MKPTITKFWSSVLILTLLNFLSFAQINRYVDPAGADSGNCEDPHAPCASINYAISQSSTNDILNLAEGTFGTANISQRVVISGMGSGTIIQSLDLSAAISGTDAIVLENLNVTGGASPGIDIQTSYVTIKNVSSSGYATNLEISNAFAVNNILISNCHLDGATGTGLLVNMSSNGSSVSDLTVLNTSMNNSRFGFYSQMSTAINAGNYLTNVLFRNCSFNNNTDKGIYVENLNNATFENISVNNSGTSVSNGYNNGIDINLKWQAYSNLVIRNSKIIDCGAIGPNDIGIAPDNRRSTAVAIKARTDGSYASPAASLTNLTLDGVVIDGLVGDLRLGEMGQNNTGITMSNVFIDRCSFANDGLYCFVNEQAGTLSLDNNYWGGEDPNIENYNSAITNQSNELANEIVDNLNNSYATIADAIAGAASSSTIQNLPTGTISGTTTVNKALTFVAPGAGLLDSDSRIAFENLTINGGNLTLGSDMAVLGALNLTHNILINDYNLMIEGNVTGIGSITGSTTGGLYLGGSGTLTGLLTTGAFERIYVNRAGSIPLTTPIETEWLSLENGIINATANLIFTGLTALPGNSNSFVQGTFVHEVAGATVGNKLYFPIGLNNYRPIVFEGLDQNATNSYTATFFEDSPLVESILLNGVDKLIPTNYWLTTPLVLLNTTAVDKVILSYGNQDQISDLSALKVVQLQTVATWVNVGGSAGVSGNGSPNPIDPSLGLFTLGNDGGTNFTTLLDVYVNASTGDDSNSGSIISPKKTLTSGLALAQLTGSTIHLGAGIYDESVEISKEVTITGTDNPIVTSVTLTADISTSGVTANEVNVASGGSIQDGIDMASSGGSVNVSSGTFVEHLSISNPVTVNGANRGIAATATREAETILLAPTSTPTPQGIDITSSNVTIDGLQIGENSPTNETRSPIYSYGNTNLNFQNNIIYASTAGIIVQEANTGSIVIRDNQITLNDLEDAAGDGLSPNNATIGIGLGPITGTAIATTTNNDISGASYGMLIFNANNPSNPLTIDGGNITNCTKGIEITNADPEGGAYGPSEVTIQNININSFDGPDPDLVQPDTQAGIYAFVTGLAGINDDLIITMDNLDIADTQHAGTDYSAIYIADFQSSGPYNGSDDDGIGITATLSNSYLHENENRAVFVRGNNAHLDINQCTFENNGYDSNGSGYNIIVRNYASCTASNCFFTNPSSQAGGSGFAGVNILDINCSLTITESNFDQNGFGNIATGSNMNLSGNYFNSLDETDINTWVNGNDFTPYLSNGTDTDLITKGFQPATDDYYLSTLGAQTGSTSRKQEGHNTVVEGGTIRVQGGTYTGSFLINKDLNVILSDTPSFEDIHLNGTSKTLNVSGDLMITGTVTMTNGDINIQTGSMILSNSATTSISEGVTSHIIGHVTMQPRAVGTGTLSLFCTTIDAGTDDLGNVVMSRTTGSDGIVSSMGNTSIASLWNITADNQPVSGRTVTFCWHSDFDNSKDMTQISLFKNEGTGWAQESGPMDVTGNDPRSVNTNVTTFSMWTLAQEDEPLPVVLLDFTAIRKSDHIYLSWSTSSEVNSDYFEIERSYDGTKFEGLSQITSHHNSNSIQNYEWPDYAINPTEVYYRLKIVDYDGSYEYSKIVSVSTNLPQQIIVSPNPTNDYISVMSQYEIKKLEVFSISGQKQMEVMSQNQINLQALDKGLYLITVHTEYQQTTVKVIRN
ncbi:T9SS type A sorting domain-containing protein [Reichenbachiella agarivorans]|uniref:T9SS type A sorting domain-containing protein n=1 Tax=Reichenbachiella agarivorans TaxID=2979464 RepID=A0ABY6CTZ6_9BACT|nr:T9SS type A sorting domain-containing protein [Reichenbachiella agarivorans]UXP33999.1 T9SS type A sorting domain-containing protein [Reichenbachiella agarivorans]